jgi:uncharacterized protein (DUF427 family)
MKAIWNNQVLAESDETLVIEGNHYFPPNSLQREFFAPAEKKTMCSWKGEASYYDLVVDGSENAAAAWCYPEPKSGASEIKDYVAFWRGVEIAE